MKTVLFLRHAKSDWTSDYDSDHDRPLAARGRKACRRIGKFAREAGIIPDLVISSSAVRAVSTLERVKSTAQWNVPVHVTDELYGAGPDLVLEMLRRVPDDVDTVLLVGHEPTTSETIAILVGGGEVTVVTGALASVALDMDQWQEIAPGVGTLKWLIAPKLLRSGK